MPDNLGNKGEQNEKIQLDCITDDGPSFRRMWEKSG